MPTTTRLTRILADAQDTHKDVARLTARVATLEIELATLTGVHHA